jgi:hypothetical protein
VLQVEAGALLNENELPPDTLEAKVEIFFLMLGLWQAGQTTSLVALALRTNSSNGFPHSAQTNSKIGIMFLLQMINLQFKI